MIDRQPQASDAREEGRAPWYLRLGAWIGMGTGPGALMAGGGIAELVRPAWRPWSLALGIVLLTSLATASGWRGVVGRAPTVDLADRAFGSPWGSRLVGLFIFVGVCGWNGFYVGLVAGALQRLVGLPPLASGALFGAGLWILYRTGFRRWNVMVVLTGVAALAVAVLVWSGTTPGGGSAPEEGTSGASGLLLGSGLVVAYAAVFALRAPDFTWDARRRTDAVRAGLVLAVSLAAFLAMGASLYARAGSWDLSDLVTRTGVPELGTLLLVLSAIAPAVSGLHSGALSLDRIGNWSAGHGSAAVAVVGALLGATRFDLLLIPFLRVLGALMPPVLGVLLVRSSDNADWHAWVAWAMGSVVALGLLVAGLPAHVLAGVVVSAALPLLLRLPRLSTTGRVR